MSKHNFANTSRMKPEVSKIFDDLEAWLDHCRMELMKFDPKDLYKSKEYKDFARSQHHKKMKREYKSR